MIFAFLAICLFGTALAQRPRWSCSEAKRVADFDKDKFKGKWYVTEISKQINDVDCISFDYVTEDGVDHTYSEYFTREPHKIWADSDLALEISDYVPRRAIKTRSERLPLEDGIIALEYDSYAVVCSPESKEPTVTILTREQQPTKELLSRLRHIVRKKIIGNVELFNVNQLNCKAWS